MAKPNNSLTDSRGRRYYFPLPSEEVPKPKDKMPSVTTIIGIKSKPGLNPWYARQTAEAASEQFQAAKSLLQRELAAIGPSAPEEWRAAWQLLDAKLETAGLQLQPEEVAKAPQRALHRAGRVGSAVHHYIQRIWVDGITMDELNIEIKGDPKYKHLVDELRDPWLKPLHEFFADHVEEVLYGERSVYCEKHWYAGTPDMIAKMKSGKTAIIDWKTGKGVYVDVALQINAYSMAEWVEPEPVKFDPSGEPELWQSKMTPMPEVDYGLCVHLRGDYSLDTYKFNFTDKMCDFFLALNTAYKYNLHFNRKANPWWDKVYQLAVEPGATQ